MIAGGDGGKEAAAIGIRQMERLHVCLATGLFRPAIGGEERHAELLARALAERGHHVFVVTQGIPGVPREEKLHGVQVERAIRPVPRGPLFGPSYVATLARFLLTYRHAFDIIQTTYLYWDALTAAILKPLLNARLVVRLVVSGPGGDVDRFCGMRLFPLTARYDRPVLERLVRLMARRADAFVCLTSRGCEELAGLGVPPARCHIVPNGIEVARFAGVPRPTVGRRRQLVSVARFVPQKGIDVLLRALPMARAKVGSLTLTLLGEGPEGERLKALAAELGVSDLVEFLGMVPDVAPHLAAADVFVLPSRFEGIPLALLEAMAAGLPVVASAVDGNADVIRDGVDGLLVPPDDPKALADSLCRVLQDPGLAKRLGDAGQQRISSCYSVETMTSRTCEIYRQLLGASQARSPR